MEHEDPVLTLNQVAQILKARSISEARHWLMVNAPEAILLWHPPRVSKEQLLAAIARGRRFLDQLPHGPEVIA